MSDPSYLDFTHEGVFAVLDDYIHALPYSKLHSTEATTAGTTEATESSSETTTTTDTSESSGAVDAAAVSMFGYVVLALIAAHVLK